MIDFFIMEPNQGNIVLGRDLRGKAKGVYPFPRRNKNELVEEPFESIYNSDYYDGY